ncbi:flavodoxin family protein [Vibrio alfacsensis]|jgi:NAD(P)H dehydrogenase (quinone)|uniref:flavodoxin family protein n=1 Tax=Vibrio TaxID=662 RepID=UPI004069473F
MSVAVVYHSGYGHTEKQAHAVAEGANAVLVKIDENGELTEEQWKQLDEANAIVFGSPTYMAWFG